MCWCANKLNSIQFSRVYSIKSKKTEMYSHFLKFILSMQIARSDIRPHMKLAVSLLSAYAHF